jgi:hypothetical protein
LQPLPAVLAGAAGAGLPLGYLQQGLDPRREYLE